MAPNQMKGHWTKARWTDGKSAGSWMVDVGLGTALEIWKSGATEPERWSLHRLEANVPVSAKAKDVLLKSKDHPGQTLFIADPAFPALLAKAAPQLRPGNERWRYAWPGVLLGGAAALVVASVFVFNWSPSKSIAQMIPYEARDAIGKQATTSFTRGHDACTGTAGRAAVEVLAKKLSEAAGSAQTFQIDVVNWDMVNAFALPGEHIVLMSGLIEDAGSADELAGVLAHEMGHGIELHPEAGIVRGIGMSAAMELVFTGSSGTMGNIGALLLQLQYTRQAEQEADAHALRIMEKAQISPLGIANFFDRLTALEGSFSGSDEKKDAKKDEGGGLGDTVGGMLATHPPSPERAKKFRDAATYTGVPALSDAQWQSLRGICKGT
jgi:beta-barrel assembly-enhancing protease